MEEILDFTAFAIFMFFILLIVLMTFLVLKGNLYDDDDECHCGCKYCCGKSKVVSKTYVKPNKNNHEDEIKENIEEEHSNPRKNVRVKSAPKLTGGHKSLKYSESDKTKTKSLPKPKISQEEIAAKKLLSIIEENINESK